MDVKKVEGKRSRSRYRRSGGKGASRRLDGQTPINKNHVFDSRGPDVRLRGTAQQLFEKYIQLAQDAIGGDDKVMVDAYFQYAEHYFRTLNAMTQEKKRSHVEQEDPQTHHQRVPFLCERNGEKLSLESSSGESASIVEDQRRITHYSSFEPQTIHTDLPEVSK
ncbi:MAG: DUF4167 domain-containing protein [Acetobacter sp.]|nr:DUF4167 domain-containing protein [Acetobacter sp.]